MFIAFMLRVFLDMLSGAMTLLIITLKLTKKLEKYLKGSCKSLESVLNVQFDFVNVNNFSVEPLS